jgi:hypothetical protein
MKILGLSLDSWALIIGALLIIVVVVFNLTIPGP